MNKPDAEQRIVILAPIGKDARAMATLLGARGFETITCGSPCECSQELKTSAGALLITEEALGLDGMNNLLDVLRAQPAWSELPLIILTRGGESRLMRLLQTTAEAAGAAILLERPIAAETLVFSMHVALKSRQRQYLVRDLLEREQLKTRELQQTKIELEKMNRLLEEKVAERTAKLTETIAELEAFSYSISHDMRAPLRAMHGFSDVLLEDYQHKLDEQGKDILLRIGRAARRMDLLIEDILAYSKVSKSELKLDIIDLDALIPDILKSFGFPQNQLCLERPFAKAIGHEAFLSQVITNLVGNALKFVPPGSAPKVSIRTEERDGVVQVSVSDNGIGIDSTHLDRIFKIFGRVYSDQKFEGAGIGLCIAKKAVERMSGQIGVISELGKGSCFWFTLRRPQS